ncbi:MAG: hypothetical protein FWE67_00655 [Planctomycetaceae bacterium]|nr:hypothetical protein [Planctomycetaceae bacterium]
MFYLLSIAFLTFLLPIAEGFLLALYLKHIEPPEPKPERDGFGVEVPEINQPLEENITEKQTPEEVPPETPAESTAEEVKTEEAPAETIPAAPESNSPVDYTEQVLQSVAEIGISVDETLNQMLSDTPVEVAPDLERRIEENAAQQKVADRTAEELKDSGTAPDLQNEDKLLQQMMESPNIGTAVKPEFEPPKKSEGIATTDIASTAADVLGSDFDFETLMKSVKQKPAEESEPKQEPQPPQTEEVP